MALGGLARILRRGHTWVRVAAWFGCPRPFGRYPGFPWIRAVRVRGFHDGHLSPEVVMEHRSWMRTDGRGPMGVTAGRQPLRGLWLHGKSAGRQPYDCVSWPV